MNDTNGATPKTSEALRKQPAKPTLELAIEYGDVKTFSADVLALKYAQQFYGADRTVAEALVGYGIAKDDLRATIEKPVYIDTRGAIQAKHVLFVGVKPLKNLRYTEIQALAREVLNVLSTEAPLTRHVAMTLHGSGFGLDEERAFKSQLYGYLEALEGRTIPQTLERISIISNDQRKVADLRQLLEQRNDSFFEVDVCGNGVYRIRPRESGAELRASQVKLSQAGKEADQHKHVFVAMPFSNEMEDLYHYGIRQAVVANDFLCARIDHEIFSGSIFDQIKKKIDDAEVVIADLSGANANVYLELGYALGKGIPTIQLVRDVKELKFDVQAERCLVYDSIRTLEAKLTEELRVLKTNKARLRSVVVPD